MGSGGSGTQVGIKRLTQAGLVTGATNMMTSLPVVGTTVAATKGYLGRDAQEIAANALSDISPPDLPEGEPIPTMDELTNTEPNLERRRRQRLAQLMAMGRAGTILTGPGGLSPNNSIGGGGKQMVGA